MPNITWNDRLKQELTAVSTLAPEETRCYYINRDSRSLQQMAPARLFEDSSDKDEFWIDIQVREPTVLRALLEQLDLHPLVLEDSLDENRSSRFSSFETSLHFEFPIYDEGENDSYLSIVSVPQLLLTFRSRTVPSVQLLQKSLTQERRLNDGSKSALLYSIIDGLGHDLAQSAIAVRNEITGISRALDDEPSKVELHSIVSSKRKLRDIILVAEDQLYSVRELPSVDSEAFRVDTQREYFRDAVQSYEAALRVIHRYVTMVSELQQQYQSFLQLKTENRIRILTILSAIYMPLTLFAGIYGMNFSQMPELQFPWGYPVAIGAMLAIAMGQLFYFYKRGWFG